MIRLALILMGIGALYALLVLAHPVGRCLPCLGRKVRKRGKRKRVKCRNCKGAGLARMPGATAVHRFFWLVLGDHILDQRKADAAGRQEARKETAA